jgi:hypothetical protein
VRNRPPRPGQQLRALRQQLELTLRDVSSANRKPSLKPGEHLRALRQRLGLTLRDVYKASLEIALERQERGFVIPASRLHDFETKNIAPSIYRLYTLARVYDRKLAKILSWYGIPPL